MPYGKLHEWRKDGAERTKCAFGFCCAKCHPYLGTLQLMHGLRLQKHSIGEVTRTECLKPV